MLHLDGENKIQEMTCLDGKGDGGAREDVGEGEGRREGDYGEGGIERGEGDREVGEGTGEDGC